MICACPKCKAAIEIDAATIPDDGYFNKCGACNASFVVRKESFATRALYRSAEIACAECGNPPGAAIHCQSCHAVYPEILIIATASAANKQFSKLFASFKAAPKTTAKASQESFRATSSSGKGSGVNLPGKSAQLIIILALIVVAALAGGTYWYQEKVATQYSENFIRALLGMKSARDFEISLSNRLAVSWKAGTASTLSEADLKLTTSSKTDVDTLMKRLGKVPDKFSASNAALNKLYDSFGKLHASVTAPGGTADIYVETVKKLDTEFMKNAKELKSGLPQKISATLSESSKKYKALQDL